MSPANITMKYPRTGLATWSMQFLVSESPWITGQGYQARFQIRKKQQPVALV